jgi:hypothetical protein
VTLSLLRAAADWRRATALAALILVLVGATLILHAVYWLPPRPATPGTSRCCRPATSRW